MDASILSALIRFEKAESFQELADRAMELIGNPVILFDMNERIIAITNASVDDADFIELQTRRAVSCEQAKNLTWVRSLRRLYIQPQAAIEEYNGLTMLTRGLLVNGVAVGHLHSTAYFRPFTDNDLAVVDLIAPRLALELYQHLCVDNAQRTATDAFLQYLLTGRTLSPETIRLKTELLGWQPGKVLYVLCVDLLASNSDLHTIVSSLPCGSDDRYTSFDNHAVIFLSRTKEMEPDEFEQLAPYFSTLRASCGMSRPLSSLLELAEGYAQSRAACGIGPRIFGDRYLYRYDECLPYVLLHRAAETEDVLRYCSPKLLAFAADDARTGGELMRTLWLYLKNGRSTRAAAAALGVHKNTVLFRLGKAADALGLDFSEPRDIQHLMHSIRVLEYVDKARFFGPDA